ncbi:MAG TPA: hypothetical protein VIY30_07360, partial [Burkholderiaceae bacterium]
ASALTMVSVINPDRPRATARMAMRSNMVCSLQATRRLLEEHCRHDVLPARVVCDELHASADELRPLQIGRLAA